MQTKAPKMETAQSHLPVAEAAIVQENSSLDFVTNRAVQSFTAESPAVAMDTQTAVSVHEVVGATREAELVQPEKPKTRKGARVLPEKTETVVADVQVAYAEQPMEDFVPGAVF